MWSLQKVPQAHIPEIWEPLQQTMLASPEVWEGEYQLPQIYQRLMDHKWQLWVFVNEEQMIQFSFLTRIVTHDLGDSMEILWGSGIDAREAVKYMNQVEDVAIRIGCRELRVCGRPGWLKLLQDQGYSFGYTVIGKMLMGPGKGH